MRNPNQLPGAHRQPAYGFQLIRKHKWIAARALTVGALLLAIWYFALADAVNLRLLGAKSTERKSVGEKHEVYFLTLEKKLASEPRAATITANRILDAGATLKTSSTFVASPIVDRAVFKAAVMLLKHHAGDGSAPAVDHAERAQFALSILSTPDLRIDLALQLIRKEAPFFSTRDGLLGLLVKIQNDVQKLPTNRQDEVHSELAAIVVQSHLPKRTEAAYQFAGRLVNPSARASTLHRVAVTRLALLARQRNSLVADALATGHTDAGLTVALWNAAEKSKTDVAVLLALAIHNRSLRDRMLRFVSLRASRHATLWRVFPALLAISDSSTRDQALLQFVNRAVHEGYIHEATLASRAMSAEQYRVIASALVAERLSRDGYALRAASYLPTGEQIEELRGGSRAAAAAHTAIALAQLNRLEEAQEVLDLAHVRTVLVSQAALEIAKGLARNGAEFSSFLSLIPHTMAHDTGMVTARAAAAAVRAGDPEAGLRLIARLPDLASRLSASAFLALEVQLPRTWILAARAEARQTQASDVDVHALLAAYEVSLGNTDLAWEHLKLATSSDLIDKAGREIAKQLALADRWDDISRLADVLRPENIDGRDAFLRAGALALANEDRIDRAAYLARSISGSDMRVQTFRQIAALSAHENDKFSALSGGIQSPPDLENSRSNLAPVIKRASFHVYEMDRADLGDHVPTLPNASSFTSRSILSLVPEATANNEQVVEIAPMASNGYNKKFLTARTFFDGFVPGGPTLVMKAQNTSYPVYLHLGKGIFDLPSLHDILVRRGHGDLLARDGKKYTLRVPLFISGDATLIIAGSDVGELRLSQERVAYIVNAGNIFVTETRITSWSEENNAPVRLDMKQLNTFRPFYIAWSNSVTNVAKSQFVSLGHSAGKAYGFSFSNGPLNLMSVARAVRDPTGTVVDSSFQDMLYGFYSWEAADVTLVGNEYRNNLIYGIDPHDWSKRLLIAYNTTYGSLKKHGIIGSRHVEDSWFLGNLTFDNQGSGMMMDRFSGRNVLYANTSFDNRGNGISIYESPCNIVSSNKVFRNSGNGIMFRNSWDVGLYHNKILYNKKLGIGGFSVEFIVKPDEPIRNLKLDPYERFTTGSILGNAIINNGAGGVGMQGMGAVAIKENTVIGSPQRAYIGDLREVEADIARQGKSGIIIGGSCPRPKIRYTCGFTGNGFLSQLLDKASQARPRYPTCPSSTTVDAATAKRSGSQSYARAGLVDDSSDGAPSSGLASIGGGQPE